MKKLIYHENAKVGKHEIFLGFFSCFRHFVLSLLIFFGSGLSGFGFWVIFLTTCGFMYINDNILS
jgi:hypothetical protein